MGCGCSDGKGGSVYAPESTGKPERSRQDKYREKSSPSHGKSKSSGRRKEISKQKNGDEYIEGGSVPIIDPEKPRAKDKRAKSPSPSPMTQKEIEVRRKKMAESAEARKTKDARRGLTKEGEIEAKMMEKKRRDMEKLERDRPKNEYYALQYKK